MNNKTIVLILAGILIVGVSAGASRWKRNEQPTGHAAETSFSQPSGATSISQARENTDNGVTVVVTPPDLSNTSTVWNFDVVMSTHVQELGGYDLGKMATLVDDQGKTYKPISWTPDAKEGHHIGGTLSFDRIPTSTKSVTVKIVGIVGDGERVFQWNSK